ncbi:MAG: hypothetical protein PHH43_00620 [Candidatus Cloacimonetes bacterium]|nr:hypothetical protein [Candidatus Cloacimonadota bacterium]
MTTSVIGCINSLTYQYWADSVHWAANLRIGRDSEAALEASSGCCGKAEFATPCNT